MAGYLASQNRYPSGPDTVYKKGRIIRSEIRLTGYPVLPYQEVTGTGMSSKF
jgi:hypothetical protein